MPIAELFLGAFLQVLFDRLASPELLNFARREGIETLLENWKMMLIRIDKVLHDAEDRILNDDLEVKPWLEELRNLAYDIDDLLDEFATKSAENKSQEEPSCSKSRSLPPICCFRLSPGAFLFDYKMRSKIKEMDGRLKWIITLKDSLKLRENDEGQSAYRRSGKPLPTTHLPEHGFVSREDEKNEILKLLTGEEDGKNLKVIPIVGMGGVGKTALAQQVYNDARIDSYFHVKAWACVSDNFDVLAITKSILGNFLSCEDGDLNWFQGKLKENLSGKKFLIVLDDVWNEKYGNWTTLMKPFQWGAKGSKILITTRNSRVASLAGASPYFLRELPDDACMTLFAIHALGDENFDHHPHLEELGRKIVGKCKGLPLAVKALAGVLRGNVDPHHWEDKLNSKIWDQPNDEILPALKLSYLHLPFNLRRCFAYCAIFPKDYEIQRHELVRWWIAEGLVWGKETKDHWKTGLDYFDELVYRSLFQKSSSDGSQFLMHDLVNDLAKLVAGATYFSSGDVESECGRNKISVARHASFIPSLSCYITSQRFEIYHEMKKLRSFISLSASSKFNIRHYLFEKGLCDLLSDLKCLRVLSLQHYRIKEVPNCIGRLRHLRYLNLSHTHIETLPEWIVALYNLEALMLRGCPYLTKLPEDIKKMKNLTFLDITDTPNLKMMPPYIGDLTRLEMLPKFVVGTKTGSRLKELKKLKKLEGELCISGLHKVGEARDAMDADLRTTNKICRLTMQWCKYFENSRNVELEKEVLEFLHPHQNLENLNIFYYGGLEFPSWLGSPLHVNMTYLRLRGCQSVRALPSLGQLSSLKELHIEGLHGIYTIGYEFYGNGIGTESLFPSLTTLIFWDMPSWRNWTHNMDAEDRRVVVFPRLEHLVIRDCPLLIGSLPSRLDSLIKLGIVSCLQMDASLSMTSLPSLKELSLRCCNQGVLKKLVDLTSLTALVIEDVADLTCLHDGFTSFLKQLKELEMRSCGKLVHLWQDRAAMQNLVCLEKLIVKKCGELISFMPGEGDMEVELPSNLETIELSECDNLEKLPSKLYTLSSLRELIIYECPKLVSFPEAGIPKSVTSIFIFGCEMLWSLPRGVRNHPDEARSSSSNDMTCSPQEITINECNSLPVPASPFSVPLFLPAALKTLHIWKCKGVESLAEINVDPLQSLQQIGIGRCEKLRSLPRGLHTLSHLTSLFLLNCPALELECFPPLPPAISSVCLRDCPKIKALPHQLHQLTCLRNLSITNCESITRFPDGGLPPQLQFLYIKGCENMKQPVREWEWLPHLTSLESLRIDGSVGGVGEEEDLLLPLPSSLRDLYISDMKKVKRLSRCLPPSLRTLDIKACPKLRELPLDDGLPPSLETLIIYNCRILKERFTKRTGGSYRHLLREIPHVEIDFSHLRDS